MVGKSGQFDDLNSEGAQHIQVVVVLQAGAVDVDRGPVAMGQFTLTEFG